MLADKPAYANLNACPRFAAVQGNRQASEFPFQKLTVSRPALKESLHWLEGIIRAAVLSNASASGAAGGVLPCGWWHILTPASTPSWRSGRGWVLCWLCTAGAAKAVWSVLPRRARHILAPAGTALSWSGGIDWLRLGSCGDARAAAAVWSVLP